MSVFGVKTSFPPSVPILPPHGHTAALPSRKLLFFSSATLKFSNQSLSLSGSEIEMSPDYGRKDANADRVQSVDWI